MLVAAALVVRVFTMASASTTQAIPLEAASTRRVAQMDRTRTPLVIKTVVSSFSPRLPTGMGD